MWRGGVGWAALSLTWALACGGRYERSAPTSDAVGYAGSPAAANSGASAAAGSAGVMDVACAEQLSAYQAYRSQVVAEFSSLGCSVDDDCRSLYVQSPCDPACFPLTSAGHRGIIDRLNMYGTANCASECWPQPWVTCPTRPPVHCLSGRCQ